MSHETITYAIRQFFGGNFHQDWDLEAEDWQGVVGNYAAGASTERLHALAQDIDNLRQAHVEDELKVLMPKQALSAYNPRPQTYKEWLGLVAELLRQHATAVKDSGAS